MDVVGGDEARRRRAVLAWSVPVAVAVSALLPLAGGRAGAMFGSVGGTLVFQLIWFVWSLPLAASVGWLRSEGRAPGPVWAVLQAALLGLVVVADLPSALQVLAPGPVERFVAGTAFLAVPLAVVALSAAEGLVLFLRA